MSNCSCQNHSSGAVRIVDGKGIEYNTSVDIDGVKTYTVPTFKVSDAAGNRLSTDGFVNSQSTSVFTERFSFPASSVTSSGVLFSKDTRIYCNPNVTVEGITTHVDIPFFEYTSPAPVRFELQYATGVNGWETVLKRNGAGVWFDLQAAGSKYNVYSCSTTGLLVKYRMLVTLLQPMTYGNIEGSVFIRKDELI